MTTICAVKKGNQLAMAGDGQVTMGETDGVVTSCPSLFSTKKSTKNIAASFIVG